jgi:hypothetical protein
MGRNTYQVMGLDHATPSQFVICWTPKGLKKGGTALAWNYAEQNNIEVFNLAKEEDLSRIMAFLN